MPRGKRGWLKPDALKTAGVTEQYAVILGNTRHEIELWWDAERETYVTTYKRIPLRGLIEGDEWRTGHSLGRAREHFERVMRDLQSRS